MRRCGTERWPGARGAGVACGTCLWVEHTGNPGVGTLRPLPPPRACVLRKKGPARPPDRLRRTSFQTSQQQQVPHSLFGLLDNLDFKHGPYQAGEELCAAYGRGSLTFFQMRKSEGETAGKALEFCLSQRTAVLSRKAAMNCVIFGVFVAWRSHPTARTSGLLRVLASISRDVDYMLSLVNRGSCLPLMCLVGTV